MRLAQTSALLPQMFTHKALSSRIRVAPAMASVVESTKKVLFNYIILRAVQV